MVKNEVAKAETEPQFFESVSWKKGEQMLINPCLPLSWLGTVLKVIEVPGCNELLIISLGTLTTVFAIKIVSNVSRVMSGTVYDVVISVVALFFLYSTLSIFSLYSLFEILAFPGKDMLADLLFFLASGAGLIFLFQKKIIYTRVFTSESEFTKHFLNPILTFLFIITVSSLLHGMHLSRILELYQKLR
jgi:hypothetical protein